MAPKKGPTREVVKVDVKFTLVTPDGLRKVVFELEKDTDDKGGVDWKITFQLFEREKKSGDFGDPIVDLLVEVDSKLNNKAQTVADEGLTARQAAFALGPAADTAKDDDEDEATKAKTVQATLNK